MTGETGLPALPTATKASSLEKEREKDTSSTTPLNQMSRNSPAAYTALQVFLNWLLKFVPFLSDCTKVKISLRQVSKGPIYELDANLTCPSTEDISSLVMVSH